MWSAIRIVSCERLNDILVNYYRIPTLGGIHEHGFSISFSTTNSTILMSPVRAPSLAHMGLRAESVIRRQNTSCNHSSLSPPTAVPSRKTWESSTNFIPLISSGGVKASYSISSLGCLSTSSRSLSSYLRLLLLASLFISFLVHMKEKSNCRPFCRIA